MQFIITFDCPDKNKRKVCFPRSMLIAIVPAHNEEKDIENVIKSLKNFVKKIIVVDDGSKDKTSKIAEKNGAIVLKHIVNLGKGAAMRTGIEKAKQMNAKSVIFVDADNQHDPSEIPLFKNKIKQGAKIIQGTRKFDKKMPFIKRFGNSTISNLFKILFGVKVNDTQSGYKAMSLDIYDKIKWSADGYFVETEMLVRAAAKK